MIILLAVLLQMQAEFQNQLFEDNDLIILAKKNSKADSVNIVHYGKQRIAEISYNDGNSGYFVLSSDFSRLFGYQGITVLGIVLDTNLNISEVKIIHSEDTRSFVRGLKRKSFLDQFIGAVSDSEIETVTGSTITSKAVIETVQETLIEVCEVIKDYQKGHK